MNSIAQSQLCTFVLGYTYVNREQTFRSFQQRMQTNNYIYVSLNSTACNSTCTSYGAKMTIASVFCVLWKPNTTLLNTKKTGCFCHIEEPLKQWVSSLQCWSVIPPGSQLLNKHNYYSTSWQSYKMYNNTCQWTKIDALLTCALSVCAATMKML